MKIKDIPKDIRPREKAIRNGVENVNDEELLALIIGSGVRNHSALEIGRGLLDTYLTLPSLANTNLKSLVSQDGLSENLALRLLATFEFHNRLNSPMYQYQYTINKMSDLYQRYKYLENYQREVLVIIMLNKKHKIIKEKILYKGTNNEVTIEPLEIIHEVILANSNSYILLHNHPDGSSFPSDADIYITEALKEKAKDIQIQMLDHVIIYQGGYYSFLERNSGDIAHF